MLLRLVVSCAYILLVAVLICMLTSTVDSWCTHECTRRCKKSAGSSANKDDAIVPLEVSLLLSFKAGAKVKVTFHNLAELSSNADLTSNFTPNASSVINEDGGLT